MRNSILAIGTYLMISVLIPSCNDTSLQVNSPDETIQVRFTLKDGIPRYIITKNGKSVIEPSAIGFVLRGQSGNSTDHSTDRRTDQGTDQGTDQETDHKTDLGTAYRLVSVEESSADGSWEQPWGEFRTIADRHNELVVHLVSAGRNGILMDIRFRVFDDGVGFRYAFPEQPGLDSVVVMDELTQFTFPDDHQVWWIPVHSENSYYESLYRKSQISGTDTINTPATFETHDGLYLAIHEANLTDFASMTLRRTGARQYVSELVPWSNGVKVYAKAPFESPWRTIIIGEEPGDLVTSTLVLNLNDPCKLDDVSWIEPSKYIGIWWGMHLEKYTWGQGPDHGATTERVMRYIDFAGEHGLDGVLVEGWNRGWDGNWSEDGTKFSFTESYPDFDLETVASCAADKNVRLIGHHETGGAVANYEKQMEDAFALYQQHGVNAVKTGYVNKYLDGSEWHDGQYGVRHYRKVVETAARYRIMIDNHEPVKGTGLQRTYPNLMTQEGGRGQEYDAWSGDGGNPPSHTTILPFTRMLAGPFDFTPGTFDFGYRVVEGTRVNTTLAKQLALYVIIFSPQQMASDLPENYEGNPAFEFIKQVPCTWSDTKVLDAVIGEYVTMARKDWNSDEWYIGSITNETPRTIELDFSFLEEGLDYRAEIYADGAGADYLTNPEPVKITYRVVHAGMHMNVELAPGGGTAIRLVPLP
ncbi:MAG TPA: glycoside hydrolase family 97 protein [Bacteroides sp.]|nr:glycoside hydrolase family 97 protein [Bacteroides sp.]